VGLRNEGLSYFYSSSGIAKVVKKIRIRRLVSVARNGETRIAYKITVGKPRGILRHRWEGHIEMDLNDIGCKDVSLINLTQDKIH
jgi:hypothetical protein